MKDEIKIRGADHGDSAALAQFNIDMAWETEGIKLERDTISEGVKNLIARPDRGFYLVAESEQKIVASLMVTHEWSDWRNGLFWWIQSVYVVPDFRQQGLYRRLYESVKAKAAQDESVIGFRLYVEQDNKIAQTTYIRCGMHETVYKMFEEMIAPSLDTVG
ncbi:MAG: GNAT family N-acetyltransferase [Pseudomonadota bacterium]